MWKRENNAFNVRKMGYVLVTFFDLDD